MDFGLVATAINIGLNSTRSIYLFDLLSIWSVYLTNILCDQSAEVNTTVEGMTGSFSLAPDGTVSRLNWFMNFYKGLGHQHEWIGNWSSVGDFHFEPAKLRTPTDQVLKSELNVNVFRVVTL
uniref:Lig_chan-Glu_bd domain-containing protein n=1 Tax=Macrostomum lignano TaxID=282301 RepID=A0A1I8JE17_9PLAT